MGYLITFVVFSAAAWFAASMLIFDVLCDPGQAGDISNFKRAAGVTEIE